MAHKYEPWNAVPIVPFLESVFILPDGNLVKIVDWQKAFLEETFTPDENGMLKYKHITFSTVKKCLDPDERVWLRDGSYRRAKDLVGQKIPLWSMNEDTFEFEESTGIVTNNGKMPAVRITLRNGRSIVRSANERAYTWNGWQEFQNIQEGTKIAIPRYIPDSKDQSSKSNDTLLRLAQFSYNTQSINEEIFHLNSKDLHLFLQILHTKNGYQTIENEMGYFTWNEQYANDLAALCNKIGLFPIILEKQTVFGNTGFLLIFNKFMNMDNFTTSKNLEYNQNNKLSQADHILWEEIKKIEFLPDQEMICIEVPSHGNYLTYTITGNSGKSTLGAMIILWYALSGIAEPNNEIILAANSACQADERVYRPLRKAFEQNPILKNECVKINDSGIELKNGTVIKSIASEYSTAAGSNQGMSSFDEIWAFTSQRDQELWTEMTPPPTRKNAIRFVSTYAGIPGESILLENIYQKMVRPENRIDLGFFKEYETGEMSQLPVYVKGDSICLWDHVGRMPWHTKEYIEGERNQPGLTHNGFQRIHRNEWVSNVEGIEPDEWEAANILGKEFQYFAPLPPSRSVQLAIGIDASVYKDRTAVVSIFKKGGKIWLGPYKFWQPSKEQPINFDEIIKYIDWLNSNYSVSAGYYDPYQLEYVGQQLRKKGLPVYPLSQTIPNTMQMTELVLDLLRERNFVKYPDENLDNEAKQVSIKEVIPRGRRFVKDKSTKKIDSIIALSMACLAGSKSLPDLEQLTGQVMRMRRRR